MKKILPIIGVLLLVGCQSSPTQNSDAKAKAPSGPKGHEATLAQWKGKKVDDLVVAWGVATETQRLPRGGMLLSYRADKTIGGSDMSGVGRAVGMGALSMVLDSSGSSSDYECVVNVKVSSGGIVETALISRQNNPMFEDLCGRIIRPPFN